MASHGISSVKSQRRSRSITAALASAVLEWLLICMLFIDAIFSYLITKLSIHWELPIPCLLCSRLDHILGNTKLKYYRDLICRNHKLEITSLVFCHSHNKLVDVNEMCESCLFSFATTNKSNAETYRLLVGKLGEDSTFGLGQDSSSYGQIPSARPCSCCNVPWVPRSCGPKLMKSKSCGSDSEAANTDIILSGILGHGKDTIEKGKRYVSVRRTDQGTRELDSLSLARYSKLNVSSDAESEVLSSSDDDDANPLLCVDSLKNAVEVGCAQPEPRIIAVPGDWSSEKLINPVFETEPINLVSQVQSDVIANQDFSAVRTPVSNEHGLHDLNWQQVNDKADLSELPELISFDEVIPSSITIDTPVDASAESKLVSIDEVPPSPDTREVFLEALKERKVMAADEVPASLDSKKFLVEGSEEIKLISVDDIPSVPYTGELPAEELEEHQLNSVIDGSSSGADTPVRGLEENCVGRPEEALHSALDCDEFCKVGSQPATTSETASEFNPVLSDNGVQNPNLLDLSDAYKLAVENRGRPLSGLLVEQWTGKDSSRISEDLKLLRSQLSAARESLSDMSPRVPISPRVAISPKLSLNSEDIRAYDASSAIGMQILQQRISLERNESGLSLDGSVVSEVEGETIADRLKRQVEHDKKLLSALYKELEEERNASTIAASQAMAMITRLQEEKATIHMEALQCLRMMEEQAEYDMEALQKTNDFLAEKEKEVQELEAELEFYRNKYPNEPMLQDIAEQVTVTKATDIEVDNSEAGCAEDSFLLERTTQDRVKRTVQSVASGFS